MSTLALDVNVPPAVWPRLLTANAATELATGRDDGTVLWPAGARRRTAEAPAALLGLGTWDTRGSGGDGALPLETRGAGAEKESTTQELGAKAMGPLPPTVAAPFSVVALAHADGCVSVNALTRDAWPDDDLIQVCLVILFDQERDLICKKSACCVAYCIELFLVNAREWSRCRYEKVF